MFPLLFRKKEKSMHRNADDSTISNRDVLKHEGSLRKYFLLAFTIISLIVIAIITYPITKTYSKSHFKGRKERSVAEMYDQDDLSACSLFAGNFINFGFWEHPIEDQHISLSQRIESEKNLYRFVAKNLGLNLNDRVLEVACGQGVGSALVLNEFNVREMHGIDFSKSQILRAKKINSKAIEDSLSKLLFQQGSAERIPYGPESFEKIFSIEAVQHFDDLDLFIKEAHRVLKTGGKIAIASFFGTSGQSHKALSSMIQTIRDGIDRAIPIQKLGNTLKKNGFKNVKIKSIGGNVWQGFDQWTSQTDLKDSWTRNWYLGYQKNLVDYYLITADK